MKQKIIVKKKLNEQTRGWENLLSFVDENADSINRVQCIYGKLLIFSLQNPEIYLSSHEIEIFTKSATKTYIHEVMFIDFLQTKDGIIIKCKDNISFQVDIK